MYQPSEADWVDWQEYLEDQPPVEIQWPEPEDDSHPDEPEPDPDIPF